MAQKQKLKKKGIDKAPKVILGDKKPVLTIVLKFAVLILLVVLGVYFSDAQGYFNSNKKNNHTEKKWKAFQSFTESNNVDVILLGNSHLYTGINPKNLSSALGCNAFILASPGTMAADYYYSLKEALERSEPKLVIIETYGLKKLEQFNLKEGDLTDQIKSFRARKNVPIKLASMPYLFRVENYIDVWSNTIRNHDFLYTNYKQIEKNIKLNKIKNKAEDKLYLGRFVSFLTGIEDTTIEKYNSGGPVVNGEDYEINDEAIDYIQKIIELCTSKDIEVLFLTLPMYKKHIENYDVWKDRLANALGDFASDDYWFDMQVPENYDRFTPESFQNTLKLNQHMTFKGSIVATYKLVDFIRNQSRIEITDRRNNYEWQILFYREEGYFENNDPISTDTLNRIIKLEKANPLCDHVVYVYNEEKSKLLIRLPLNDTIKVENYLNKRILALVQVRTEKGFLTNAKVEFRPDPLSFTKEKLNYITFVKPLEILKIYGMNFIDVPLSDTSLVTQQ